MKKIFSIILCIFIFYCSFIIADATEDAMPEDSVTVCFLLDGATSTVGSATLKVFNIDTNQAYTIDISAEDEWKSEAKLVPGKYKVTSLKSTSDELSLSLVKTAGSQFIINYIEYTDVILPVTQIIHITTAKDFLLNNILVLVLIFGSGIGLLVIKSKRDKGEE